MESSELGLGATTRDASDNSQISETHVTEAQGLILGIRQAYESGRPLYPINDVNELLQFAAQYRSNPNADSTSYRGPDFFGHEQWWTFSEDQLHSAKLDLSPIQWLITMPYACSDPQKLLTRAFSLQPMGGIQVSTSHAKLRSPDPSRYIQEQFTKAKSKWHESDYKTRIDGALRNAFTQCFAHDDQPFTKILVIGTGTLELDITLPGSNWKCATKHVFGFDLRNMLQGLTRGRAGIELVFQDSEYSDITKEASAMQDPTVKVVREDNLDHILHIDDHTLLVALGGIELPLKQIIAEYATATPCEQRLPRAIIWEEGIQVTWEDMEKMAAQYCTGSPVTTVDIWRDSPRTNKLEDQYVKFEFPAPEEGEPDYFQASPRLAIYVRK
ncbi:hypothetical protein F5Y08DRAFT_85417 [Xylaria arbuscula]|nr:hypothetical protein F5Y08DRAFT_85417 [Xylaria arbuscula]